MNTRTLLCRSSNGTPISRRTRDGYVNDTGLIDGLPFNPIASIIFGQVICGNAIAFGSFNLENEYDGDEHPIGEDVIEAVKRQWFLWKHNADEREMRTV